MIHALLAVLRRLGSEDDCDPARIPLRSRWGWNIVKHGSMQSPSGSLQLGQSSRVPSNLASLPGVLPPNHSLPQMAAAFINAWGSRSSASAAAERRRLPEASPPGGSEMRSPLHCPASVGASLQLCTGRRKGWFIRPLVPALFLPAQLWCRCARCQRGAPRPAAGGGGAAPAVRPPDRRSGAGRSGRFHRPPPGPQDPPPGRATAVAPG